MSRKFGDIDFTGKDIGIPAVKFDRLAISGRGEILLLSLFAEAQRIKAIRSVLAGGAKVTCQAVGISVKQDGASEWDAHSPGRVYPSSEGYNVHTHKLGFGLVHALFLSRSAGFIKVVTEESLWQELKGERFTTPMLRPWVPYIENALRQKELLENAHCFGCRCGILSASTSHLDEIVSQGLKDGDLEITDEEAKANLDLEEVTP